MPLQNLFKTLSLRASATPRVTKCPGSMLLPAFETTSSAARLGTAIHEVCEGMISEQLHDVAVIAAKHDVDNAELQKLAWNARQLWSDFGVYFPGAHTEIAISTLLDLSDAFEELEITGHADIISLPGDGSIRIGDWKSGWHEGDYGAQLKTYAMLALEKYHSSEAPIDRVIVSVLWLRDRTIESETFSRDQLDAWREKLTETGRAAVSGVLRIGEQCHYCPVANCPALQSKAVLFLVPLDGSDRVEITPENAADLYFLAQALGKRIDDVKMALKQFVAGGGPIPTSNGKLLDLRPTNRETIALTPESAQVLQTQFTEAEMFAACDINKTRLLDTVRSRAPKGEKTAAGNTMMDDLRSVGAVSVSVSQSLAIVKPQLEEAE